jgi:hypothetical protein
MAWPSASSPSSFVDREGNEGEAVSWEGRVHPQHLHLYHLPRLRRWTQVAARMLSTWCSYASTGALPHDRRFRLKALPAHAHPTGRRPSSPTPGSADAIPAAFGSQRAPQSLRSSRIVHRFFIILVGTAPWAHLGLATFLQGHLLSRRRIVLRFYACLATSLPRACRVQRGGERT